jgi:peptide/nickel transport system ATP-binding protein
MSDGLSVRRLFVGGPTGALVHDVDVDAPAGAITAVIGPSGAGKTLLLRGVLDVVAPLVRRAASVRLDGVDVRRGDLGYVPQDAGGALDPLRPVGDQVRTAARAGGRPDDPLPWLIRAGLDDAARVESTLPERLSGGMAQRVVVAQALARGQRALLADEPTNALDPLRAARVHDALRRFRDDGGAVLVVTHDLRALTGFADRVIVVDAGRVVETSETGDPGALTHPVARALVTATWGPPS